VIAHLVGKMGAVFVIKVQDVLLMSVEVGGVREVLLVTKEVAEVTLIGVVVPVGVTTVRTMLLDANAGVGDLGIRMVTTVVVVTPEFVDVRVILLTSVTAG